MGLLIVVFIDRWSLYTGVNTWFLIIRGHFLNYREVVLIKGGLVIRVSLYYQKCPITLVSMSNSYRQYNYVCLFVSLDIDSEFKQFLYEFVPILLSPKNLVVKKINGITMTGKGLLQCFQVILQISKLSSLLSSSLLSLLLSLLSLDYRWYSF